LERKANKLRREMTKHPFGPSSGPKNEGIGKKMKHARPRRSIQRSKAATMHSYRHKIAMLGVHQAPSRNTLDHDSRLEKNVIYNE